MENTGTAVAAARARSPPLMRVGATLLAAVAAGGGVSVADTPGGVGASLDQITVVATGVSNMTGRLGGRREPGANWPASLCCAPARVLENVPGLIVTQHSGEGKANQYFLRAFNLDHGTDLATEVDDMPVNMPTHAHGQGYTDLNFLIPELVGDLHFKKGPYYADEGDFATAGAVRMDLVNEVPDSATAGFRRGRLPQGLADGIDALAAAPCSVPGRSITTTGRSISPTTTTASTACSGTTMARRRTYFTVTGMAYSGKWNSTDQVPQHAITRDSSAATAVLNPTDGGTSSR